MHTTPSEVRRPRPLRLTAMAAGLALAALSPAACKDDPLPGATPADPNQKDKSSLIGGFAANDPRLDAIGTMVLIPPTGGPNIFICGAGLITPETLLTAKHCVDIIPLAFSFGYRIGFSVGPDVARPRKVVEVVAFDTAPGDEGGFVEMGRDVAVLHLEHPITDLTPLAVGTFSDEDIGQAFAAIGYGVQDNTGTDGTRRMGKETLRGREGRHLELMFGTFERFLEWFKTGNVTAQNLIKSFPGAPREAGSPGTGGTGGGAGTGGSPGGYGGGGGNPGGYGGAGGYPGTDGGQDVYVPPTVEEMARYFWDLFVIEKGYEVVTGGAPGDAQSCYGDSGSPLMKSKDGQLVTYGVVSGGVGSNDLICDLGTVFATFGPEVSTFIDEAKAWVDPCGDLGTRGTCDGNVAKRCTNIAEGRRRLVEFDCGLVGMTCNTNQGQVSCDDNVYGPPGPTRKPTAETPRQLRDMVNRVWRSGTP